jgi:serine protease Do
MPTLVDEPQVSEAAVKPALDLSDAFIAVSEEVTPAVVRIETTRSRRMAQSQVPEAFRRFFPDQEQGPSTPQISGGSGFIVSADGYILTNNHVVDDAETITVILNDRRTFTATVVGTDPTTDVAVIKIDEPALPTLSFGESDAVRVGEWVLAVGNPGYGGGSSPLDYTVTAGIVSAKGRPLQLINRELLRDPDLSQDLAGFAIEDFIQTDAVINPGNSGGPLVDLRGQVIGINSAIASNSGYYQGYGFAVPIDLARRVMEDLIEYGRVRRAYLGIRMETVTPEDAEVFGLESVAGAVIQDVTEGTPALEAGLRFQDVVVAVDGEPVRNSNDLQQRIARRRPGENITLRVFRDGSARDIQIRLGEAPFNEVGPPPPVAEARMEEKIGIEVLDMTEELASRFGFEDAAGPIINDVLPNGPAFRRGIGPGWRILEINRVPVVDADDVQNVFRDVAPGDVVSLVLEDPDGGTRIVNVRVPR